MSKDTDLQEALLSKVTHISLEGVAFTPEQERWLESVRWRIESVFGAVGVCPPNCEEARLHVHAPTFVLPGLDDFTFDLPEHSADDVCGCGWPTQ